MINDNPTNKTEWVPWAGVKLRAYLDRPDYKIPRGLGTEDAACSLGAINVALYGYLAENVPVSMSPLVARWIVGVQDSLPDHLRNSAEWKNLLPLAAVTGRDYEDKRWEIVADWIWGTVLPAAQDIADTCGMGPVWSLMCEKRTVDGAKDVVDQVNDLIGDSEPGDFPSKCLDLKEIAGFAVRVFSVSGERGPMELATGVQRAVAMAEDVTWLFAGKQWKSVWETLRPFDTLRRLVECPGNPE